MKDMNFGSEIQDVELGVRGFVAPASRRHFPAPFEIRKNRRLNDGALRQIQARGCALSYTSINCRIVACVYRCVVDREEWPSNS